MAIVTGNEEPKANLHHHEETNMMKNLFLEEESADLGAPYEGDDECTSCEQCYQAWTGTILCIYKRTPVSDTIKLNKLPFFDYTKSKSPSMSK